MTPETSKAISSKIVVTVAKEKRTIPKAFTKLKNIPTIKLDMLEYLLYEQKSS